jgi:hypothetical protein
VHRAKATAWAAALLACASFGWALAVRGPADRSAGTSSPRDARPRAPTAPTGGGGDGIGLFERFAGDARERESLAARLFSPLPALDECIDFCPPALEVVGGPEGARSAAAALDGIEGAIERLVAEPALEREMANAVGATLRAIRASAGERSKRSLRALFVRGGTDVPAGAHAGVGLAVSDLHDGFFDRRREWRGGGARILVNRVEDGYGIHRPGRLLGGVIELAGDGVGGGSADLADPEVAALRNPIGLHFRGERLPLFGIALGLDGSLFTYGYFGTGRRRLSPDPSLRDAVEGVLRSV